MVILYVGSLCIQVNDVIEETPDATDILIA